MSSPPPPPSCPTGQYWDYQMQKCASGSPAPPPSGSYPPPGSYQSAPSCPPGQYWDFNKQMCADGGMVSGAPPASCGPDQYWDYQLQKCASGRPPPPPGCTADGYCPPPPQYSCKPGDPYCRPPPPPECGQKMESIRSDLETLFRDFESVMKDFHQQFESARQEFFQSPHSPEESKSWSQDWAKKGQALGEQFQARMKALAESKGLGDCAQFMPPPPIMGGPMGGGQEGPRNYEQMRAPPPDNRFQQEDDAVRKIRTECESQAKEILGDFWREPGQGPPPGGQPPRSANYQGPGPGGQFPSGSQPPSGSFPSGGPRPTGPPQGGQFPGGGMQGGPTREQMEKVHEIMRGCEKKIRAHFEQVYKDEKFEEDADKSFGSFEMYFDEATNEIHVTGKYLSLKGNPDSQVISEISCGGQAFIDQLKASGYLENFDFEQTGEGTVLSIKASGSTILQIHDNPRCVINLATAGTVTELTLDLADYLDLKEEDNGVSFTDGATDGRILLHEGNLEIQDGNIVVLHSKATFLVSNGAGAQAGGSSLGKDLNVKKALEDGQIGAEINIAGDRDNLKSDATPYGDMDIDVNQTGDSLDIIVDKEDPTGKTIVIDIDEDVMTIDAISSVKVDVHEIVEGADEDFCLREADDLQDVLDPTDDEDCAEYWVVLDKNGAHVLVSLPHFSAKKITIESTSQEKKGIPNLGILGASLAAIAALVLVAVGARRKA